MDRSIMTEQKLADVAQLSFIAGAGIYVGYSVMEFILTHVSRLLAI